MKKNRILFTGAGGVGTFSIYNTLKKKYNFFFIDNNLENINPKIPKNKTLKVPLAIDKKKYENKIKLLVKKLKIDLIIPTVDEELDFYSKKYKNISLLPNNKFVNIFNDKYKTYLSLENYKINQPLLINKNMFSLNKTYPIIAKPRTGRGSQGIIKINNLNEYNFYKNKYLLNNNDYIFQKFIIGTEYSVQMISNYEGKLIAIIPVKINEKKGITINAVISKNKSVIKFCKIFHSYYSPEFVYNIQLMVTKNGIFIIEINPRISTTHILTLLSGIDPIKIFLNKSSLYRNYVSKINVKVIKLKRHYETYFEKK